QAAKRKGCRIVSINPMPEIGTERFKNPQDLKNPFRAPAVLFGHGTKIADLWLQVRINGDMAALQGIIKVLIEEGGRALDREFIATHTTGFEAFEASIRATSWDDILAGSGLAEADIRAAARIAAEARGVIACWAMGLTQHRNAVATIQEVLNFLLIGGNIGRPGAGPCPVRGHSNVQGDRTM